MSSAGTFSADITQWVENVQIDINQLLQKIVFDAYAGLVTRSPILTGRFRASWRIGIDTPDLSVEPDRGKTLSPYAGQGGSIPPDTSEVLVAMQKIAQAKFGDMIIYLTNNLDYSEALENGYSSQAPSGVLALTYLEIVNDLNYAIQTMTAY